MKSRYAKVTIIGAGLLGGSLGLALKARGLVGSVVGVGHRSVSLETARRVGAIDEIGMDAVAASRDADLVVVCTPAGLVPPLLDALRGQCAPGAVVTDVASTKSIICAHAKATWPRPLRFVGSHPMAGSEKSGAEHSDPDLYIGSTTIVEPREQVDPEAHAAICELWQSVGSHVVELAPEVHDNLVARTSHIPHIIASALAQLTTGHGPLRAVVGRGFRDMTRIAASRPQIWRDICLTNREAITAGLDDLIETLKTTRNLIARDEAQALEDYFEAGGRARGEALGE